MSNPAGRRSAADAPVAPAPPVPPAAPSPGGCLYQVLWSILGPGLVFVAGAVGILRGLPLGSAPDWFLLGAVILAVGARWLDPTPPREPGPGEGRPPARGTYAAWIVGGGILLFAISHFVAPRLL